MLTGLEFCSDKLARTLNEQIIDQESLDELREQVEEMIKVILDAEIDSALKAVILDHLQAIHQAILTYRIHGAAGLKRALDSGVGSLLRHQAELKKPESKTWLGRLTKLFERIDGYVTTGQGAKRLFGHMVELLQLGG